MFREHYQPLCRYVHQHVWDLDEARDIAQEAFARALGKSPDHPRAWLYRVASNLVRDEARAAIRQRTRATQLAGEAAARPEGGEDPVDELDRKTKREQVSQALAQLTDRDRDVLLRWDAGMSYAEIAEGTGLAPSAIGTTLARARRRLVEAHEALENQDVPL